MRDALLICVVLSHVLALQPPLLAEGAPFVKDLFRGRIAYSCDGNHNDPDDWIASPMTLAILAESGLKDRLVHFDYNCILPQTDPKWERIHAESVLGAADRYGFDKSLFVDCRKNLDKAIANIAKAIDASSADNPLHFIIAGPMEVPYRGIQKSDPAKRKFVYCISHSRWNDGFAADCKFACTKRTVIEQGVHWVQIQDQNRLLSFGRFGRKSPPEEFEPYFWMRDSRDPKVQFLWQRMLVSTRPDPSDAGMTYFLATGDETCDPAKLKALIEEHRPVPPLAARKQVRIEAENFRHLEGFTVEDRNDRSASHRLGVKLTGQTAGRIRTPFDEPFTSDAGRYDVEIRYAVESEAQSRFRLLVNGVAAGAQWNPSKSDGKWLTHSIPDLPLKRGDELIVEFHWNSRGTTRIDYVQLNLRASAKKSAPPAAARGSLPPGKNAQTHTGPWIDGALQGRIALSHDGNFNDEDDWGAFPVIIALLDACGVKDRVVHIDFNNIIQDNDPRFEKEMTDSVLGAAQRYAIPASVLHNCRTDLEAAVRSIRDAVNASSAENPLYYLLAGPMDVPYRGILAADPAKRQHVYCLSHSVWNDGFGKRRIEGRTKRDVISLGIHWIQVEPGAGLTRSTRTASTPQQWGEFQWMRDSADERLRWIYTRLQALGRCDVSDATIAYSFLTGDEHCDPPKLAAALDRKQKPKPLAMRPTIRLEAENFDAVENFAPAYGDRQVSHRVLVKSTGPRKAAIRTFFHEIYAPMSGRYDVGVRYRDPAKGTATFALRVNGRQQGPSWKASVGDWQTHAVKDVLLVSGDEIVVEVQLQGGAAGELDYVQLDYRGLDDPRAMPGQLIVDPSNPRCLKLNGGKRCFLFGAGNPEDFFFLGTRQSNGTRAGGQQEAILQKIAGTGANTFHVLAMRDLRYNLEEGNGAADANPFVNNDIAGKLNEDVLEQWEGWLRLFEAAGIYVLFNFYNDFDDYEDKAGWKLDADGNLHAQERYLIETLVKRFKHHKNIIWAPEESCNKLSRAKQQRLKKVAALVAQTDNFHHPIASMFQILYYDEVHADKVGPEDYVNDPNFKIMTWGHYSTPKKGLPPVEQYYQQLVEHWRQAGDQYVLVNTEVEKHPTAGQINRLYSWTSAMANVYTAMSSHRPDKKSAPRETFLDDGRIVAFMEGTDFHRMSPRSELKLGSTLYVLASPADSYIAYSPDASQPMGLRKMRSGTYLLRWFDTTNGNTVEQVVSVPVGDQSWPKPAGIGKETAMYVKRLPGVASPGRE